MPTPLERYLQTAYEAGCPPDQLRNFRAGEYVALPKMLQFHAAARLCDTAGGPTQIGVGGARGPGKSHALVAQMGLDDCQRRDGIKCLLLRKVGKAVREGFEDLRVRVLGRVPHEYSRSDAALRFANGSRIILGHFHDERDIDAYLGLEYDVIGVEEATTLSAAKYTAITSCNRTSRDDWRPRMYATTNPGGVGHAWFKARFVQPWRDRCETDTRFIPATVGDNPFINAEYRQTLEGLTGWLRRAWLEGDWDISAGQFFTTWRHEVHVRSREILPSWYTWLAMDYGWTHYNVIYLLAQDGDGNVYVVDEHAERRWLVPRHAEAVKDMLERHHIQPARVGAFVAGPDAFAERAGEEHTTTVADQWRAAGFKLTPAVTNRISGAAEFMRRLGDVDAKLPESLYVSERCARLIECIPSLEHDPHRPEDVLKVDTDDDGNGGDDPYDAARYGLMHVAQRRQPLKGVQFAIRRT
jgi:phage terminase large subunit